MEFKMLTQMKLSYESKQNFMELAEHETQLLAELNQALQLLQTDVSKRSKQLVCGCCDTVFEKGEGIVWCDGCYHCNT